MVKTLQVPLGEHKKPHIFIKVNTDSSRYRLVSYQLLQPLQTLLSLDCI